MLDILRRRYGGVVAAMLLAGCATDVRVHPESATIAVEFARTDTRINGPVGISLAFTPKFTPGVVMGEGRQASFAFDSSLRRMTASAALHGVTGVFVLATAERHTVVASALIDQALPPTHTVCPVEHIAGGVTQRLECVPVFVLALGDAAYTNFDVEVAPLGNGIDGVLGANVLLAQPLTIDIRQHRLVFDLPTDAARWYSARCALDCGVPTVALEVNGVAMSCAIDSRAPFSTLPRSLYKGKTSKNRADAEPDSVTLGGVSIKCNTTFSLDDKAVATLGLDFIERYAIAFDPRSRTLFFRPLPN